MDWQKLLERAKAAGVTIELNENSSVKEYQEAEAKVKEAEEKAKEKQGDLLSKIKETVSGSVKSAIEPIEKRLDDVEGKMKAFERAPSGQQNKLFNVNTRSGETYEGYKLFNQGEKIRSFVEQNPREHGKMATDEGFEEYCKFMIDFVKGKVFNNVEANMRLQKRQSEMIAKASDLAEGTSNLGGYLVDPEFQPTLVKLIREKSFALQECTVVPMGSQVLNLPKEASLVSTAWIDEAGTITASNPTFGQVQLTAKKLAGLTGGVSLELLADSELDIVSMLTEQFAYAKALELDNQVLNGTGSPVSGMLTAKAGYSVIMTADAFSAITADDLSLMMSKLSDQEVVNAKWVFNKLITHYIRTLKDSQNNYIYAKPGNGVPGSIWELPYIQSVKGPSTTGTSTAFVSLGNWKKFYVGRRRGEMTLDVDPYTNFATGQVRFRMFTRWGLNAADANAFVRLVTGP